MHVGHLNFANAHGSTAAGMLIVGHLNQACTQTHAYWHVALSTPQHSALTCAYVISPQFYSPQHNAPDQRLTLKVHPRPAPPTDLYLNSVICRPLLLGSTACQGRKQGNGFASTNQGVTTPLEHAPT